MSQQGQTEAVLAAAFGETAFEAGLPRPVETPVDDGVPNIFVGEDLAPAPAPAPATAAPAAPVPPAYDAMAEIQARLQESERQAMYYRGQNEVLARGNVPEQYAPTDAIPAYDPSSDALTAEELIQYKDSLPVIEKLSRQMAHRAFMEANQNQAALHNTVEELRNQLAQVQTVTKRSDEVALMSTVRQAVPDMDTITKSKEWKQYLRNRAPFAGGRVVQDVLQQSIDARDHETITEHLTAFKASHNISTPPAQAPAPGRTAAPAAVGLDVPAARRGISASALDNAMAKVQAGTLSREAYDSMLAQMFAAAASGSELVQ